MRIRVFLVLAIGLLLPPTVNAQQPDSDFLIIPGKSIGRYSLDWSLEQFRKELGPEDALHRDESTLTNKDGSARTISIETFIWLRRGLMVQARADQDHRITAIIITSVRSSSKLDALMRKYHTAEGIELYYPRTAVEAAYGNPDNEQKIGNGVGISLSYWIGIGFDFLSALSNSVDIVTRIRVFPAAQKSEGNFLIVPGKSIGKYSLDWPLVQFRNELGPENNMSQDESALRRSDGSAQKVTIETYSWFKQGLLVQVRPDLNYRVTAILIMGFRSSSTIDAVVRRYRTAEGIKLYDPRSAVEAVYGKPDSERKIGDGKVVNIIYVIGIGFDFYDDTLETVARIRVFRASNK